MIKENIKWDIRNIRETRSHDILDPISVSERQMRPK